jgi:hypothetical protein
LTIKKKRSEKVVRKRSGSASVGIEPSSKTRSGRQSIKQERLGD